MTVPAVAVVGCGHRGKYLFRNFHLTGSLAEVCDLSEEGRSRARRTVPEVDVTEELDNVRNIIRRLSV